MYKIIIVDDEPSVRLGLSRVFNWAEYGFEIAGCADDGDSALELIKTVKPDAVISDVCMSRMDGIELIRLAKEINPLIEFVFMSGYADFNYAQQAMEYGAFLYLLKPIRKDEFYKIITKLTERLDAKKESDVLISSAQLVLKDSLLKNMLYADTPIAETELIAEAKKCGISYCSGTDIRLLAVTPSAAELPHIAELTDERISRQSSNQRNNLIRSLEDNQLVLAAFDFPEFPNMLADYLKQHRAAPEDMIFVSGHLASPAQAQTWMAEINRIRYCRFNNAFYGIADGINIHHKELAVKMLDTYAEDLSGENALYSIGSVPQMLLNVLSSFSEFPADKLKTVLHGLSSELGSSDKQHLLRTVSRFITSAIDLCIESKISAKQYFVRNTEYYLMDNYYKATSVEDIAKHQLISSKYLMRIFKSETGTTINRYLTDLRIEAAKILLASGRYKVNDIAYITGFNDTRYFRTIFKKCTGIIPSEYTARSSFASAFPEGRE